MRLYRRMKKRLAKKRLGSLVWNNQDCIPEIDKIYHDCDGFNHRLVSAQFLRQRYVRGSVIFDATFIREDGQYFCGCTRILLSPPASAIEVQAYLKAYYTTENVWLTEADKVRTDFFLAGGMCCNEDGTPSDAWKQLTLGLGCATVET